MQSKPQLRERYRNQRNDMSEPEYQEKSAVIAQVLQDFDPLRAARQVLVYIPYGREVDTRAAIRQMIRRGQTVYCPLNNRFAEQQRCIHLASPDDPLLTSPKPPVMLPETACTPVTIAEFDAFVVPGLAFDYEGYRLGYGGGFFDKLLAGALPTALKVGLCFRMLLLDHLPRDTWDIPVQYILTESGIYEMNSSEVDENWK